MRNLYYFTCLILLSLGVAAQTAPTATINAVSPVFCTGQPLTFSAAASSSAVSYTWGVTPTKGMTFYTNLNSNTISLTFTANLAYTISLDVADASGKGFASKVISVSRMPNAAFNASLDAAGYPNRLFLNNFSTNSTVNYWTFNDISGIDSAASTSRFYSAPGNYTVTLTAKGLKGCNATSSYAFEIPTSSSLVLPNVFTPNNDEINEVYRPIATGISYLKARIYNRYGIIIHSWTGVNGFWDGYTTSGERCPDGQYFVVVEAIGFDGQSYKLKGAITLAR